MQASGVKTRRNIATDKFPNPAHVSFTIARCPMPQLMLRMSTSRPNVRCRARSAKCPACNGCTLKFR